MFNVQLYIQLHSYQQNNCMYKNIYIIGCKFQVKIFFLIHEIVEQIIMYQNAAILQKLWLKQKTTYFIHYLRYGFIFKILCYSSGIMYFNTISANQNAAFSLHLTTFHRYEICCTRLTPAKVSDLYPLLNAQNFV